jgi:hypothetical protein
MAKLAPSAIVSAGSIGGVFADCFVFRQPRWLYGHAKTPLIIDSKRRQSDIIGTFPEPNLVNVWPHAEKPFHQFAKIMARASQAHEEKRWSEHDPLVPIAAGGGVLAPSLSNCSRNGFCSSFARSSSETTLFSGTGASFLFWRPRVRLPFFWKAAPFFIYSSTTFGYSSPCKAMEVGIYPKALATLREKY